MKTKYLWQAGLWFFLLAAAGVMLTAVLISSVRADTITVNTTDDEVNGDGDCSLREAILAANSDTAVDACTAGSGNDVITLPPGTYTLTLDGAGEDNGQTGDLDLTSNVTINGGGQNSTIIDGANTDRVFDVQDGAQATISGVTVQHGSAVSGGGVNVSGALTVSASRITANTTTGVGGGIFVGGTLTVTRSRIDALDPERTEAPLLYLAVAIGVLHRLLDRLLGDPDGILAPAVVAASLFQDFLVLGMGRNAPLDARHGKSPSLQELRSR